jgi:hypothetical protein
MGGSKPPFLLLTIEKYRSTIISGLDKTSFQGFIGNIPTLLMKRALFLKILFSFQL